MSIGLLFGVPIMWTLPVGAAVADHAAARDASAGGTPATTESTRSAAVVAAATGAQDELPPSR